MIDKSGDLSDIFPMKITPEPRVDDYFMAPADDLLRHYIRQRRDQTGGLTDERFIRLGITRALEGDESGRAFLQALADRPEAGPDPVLARSTWFVSGGAKAAR